MSSLRIFSHGRAIGEPGAGGTAARGETSTDGGGFAAALGSAAAPLVTAGAETSPAGDGAAGLETGGRKHAGAPGADREAGTLLAAPGLLGPPAVLPILVPSAAAGADSAAPPSGPAGGALPTATDDAVTVTGTVVAAIPTEPQLIDFTTGAPPNPVAMTSDTVPNARASGGRPPGDLVSDAGVGATIAPGESATAVGGNTIIAHGDPAFDTAPSGAVAAGISAAGGSAVAVPAAAGAGPDAAAGAALRREPIDPPAAADTAPARGLGTPAALPASADTGETAARNVIPIAGARGVHSAAVTRPGLTPGAIGPSGDADVTSDRDAVAGRGLVPGNIGPVVSSRLTPVPGDVAAAGIAIPAIAGLASRPGGKLGAPADGLGSEGAAGVIAPAVASVAPHDAGALAGGVVARVPAGSDAPAVAAVRNDGADGARSGAVAPPSGELGADVVAVTALPDSSAAGPASAVVAPPIVEFDAASVAPRGAQTDARATFAVAPRGTAAALPATPNPEPRNNPVGIPAVPTPAGPNFSSTPATTAHPYGQGQSAATMPAEDPPAGPASPDMPARMPASTPPVPNPHPVASAAIASPPQASPSWADGGDTSVSVSALGEASVLSSVPAPVLQPVPQPGAMPFAPPALALQPIVSTAADGFGSRSDDRDGGRFPQAVAADLRNGAASAAPGAAASVAGPPQSATTASGAAGSPDAPVPVADQVSAQLLRLVSGGSGEMVVRLRPPELGDLTVRVAVSGRDVSAWFDSPQPQVQAAIADGIGQLQTDLGNAGYNLSGAWVGADASSAHQQGAAPPPPLPAERAAELPGFAASGAALPQSSASGVSIYV